MSKRQRILGSWNEEYQGELDELLEEVRRQHHEPQTSLTWRCVVCGGRVVYERVGPHSERLVHART